MQDVNSAWSLDGLHFRHMACIHQCINLLTLQLSNEGMARCQAVRMSSRPPSICRRRQTASWITTCSLTVGQDEMTWLLSIDAIEWLSYRMKWHEDCLLKLLNGCQTGWNDTNTVYWSYWMKVSQDIMKLRQLMLLNVSLSVQHYDI